MKLPSRRLQGKIGFKIQRRGRQRERQMNNRFYKQNNNFACAPRFFVHFFSRFCTTTTWKCLISRFMGDITSDDKIQFLFLYLDMVPRNSTPGGFANIWQSRWVGIIAIKTERTQIHFLSDIRSHCPSRRWILKSLMTRVTDLDNDQPK